MTALEPVPPADPELMDRLDAMNVRCPRCARAEHQQCDMTRCPPTKDQPRTYHRVRLLRYRTW